MIHYRNWETRHSEHAQRRLPSRIARAARAKSIEQKVASLGTKRVGHLALAAWGASLLLAGCGNGSGNVAIGSGQPSDPATIDYPIAYVKRTIPAKQDDLTLRRVATPKADVYVRDRAASSAPERNITQRVTGTANYDIKDMDVSTDGTKFIFAMRGPLAVNQDPKKPPFWGIWEYTVKTDTLRRVIASDTIASEGNDISPHYLPDGRIVFASTRQRQSQAVLRDEGKPGFEAQTEVRTESAFVLHVMDPDGNNIHQVSFNQDHDIDPTVLANGRLLWSRWDNAPGSTGAGMNLYTANPDGTDLQLLYGAHSHLTGTNNTFVQFVKAREMPDGRILALTRPDTGTFFGGDLTLIDTKTYVENTQAVLASAGMVGPAQQRATPNDISTVPGPSVGGRFNSAFPLWDGTGRILVTWSQCRLLEGTTIVPCTASRLASPTAVEAPVLYSAWMFDPVGNTFKPLFDPVEGVMITDLVAAQPRALQAVILDKVAVLDFDPSLESEGVGILDIRSVYDFDGKDMAPPDAPNIATLANPGLRSADQRRARFVRLEKAVSIPDQKVLNINGAAFGATPYMREILGYAPVEPDGSVRIKVPANVAFQVSVLDRDGRRIFPVHRNWLQIKPGETKSCNGCHDSGAAPLISHGRSGLFAAVWTGAASAAPFPGTLAQYAPTPGDTMAQARARWSCTNENCKALLPSLDVKYVDVWTDATAAGRAPDASFSYTYTGAAGLTTPFPTSSSCTTTWSNICRSTINYVAHLHPLWSLPRVTLAADGVTVLSDNTCTRCHSPKDPVNGTARVPASDLDLSDGDSVVEPLQKNAYRQLLFPHNRQTVTMGALQDIQPVSVAAPSLAAGSARASTRFFSRFVSGASHAGYLTPAELRLISEWVDIGAQYFNNPFDPAVPLN